MYRVYVEDFNAPIWAVDTGPGTAQRRFDKVLFQTAGQFNYNLLANNKSEPKAWVEFPDAKLKIINNTALLR